MKKCNEHIEYDLPTYMVKRSKEVGEANAKVETKLLEFIQAQGHRVHTAARFRQLFDHLVSTHNSLEIVTEELRELRIKITQ